MSQALLFRVNALESRVAALEQRLKEVEPPADDTVPYPVIHIGRGKWAVTTMDGTRVTQEPMTKEEAESVAAELTETLAERLG